MTTIFDLDGVLSRADTMAAVIRHLNRHRPLRLGMIAPAVLSSLLFTPDSAWRARLNRWTVRTALRNTDHQTYRAAVAVTAQRLASSPGNFPPAAKTALDAALDAGSVWVATASEQAMAAAYLHAIGYPNIPLLASAFAAAGPLRIADHNVGARKVTSLDEAGVTMPTARLFTDSASDEPLARRCAHTTIVNGSRRTKRRLERNGTPLGFVRW